MSIYRLLSILLAGFCLYFGWICAFRASESRKVPRAFWAGVVVGVPCLVWSAWHGCVMLEGPLSRFHPYVWGMVPLSIVLLTLYVDYLFARAAGGFFILAANELIRQAFIWNTPCRPLYALVCLVLGVAGMFLVGTPWRMRDVIDCCVRKPQLARGLGIVFALFAAILVLLPLLS